MVLIFIKSSMRQLPSKMEWFVQLNDIAAYWFDSQHHNSLIPPNQDLCAFPMKLSRYIAKTFGGKYVVWRCEFNGPCSRGVRSIYPGGLFGEYGGDGRTPTVSSYEGG